MAELDAQTIINYISNAPKKTPVKVYLKGNLDDLEFPAEVETVILQAEDDNWHPFLWK